MALANAADWTLPLLAGGYERVRERGLVLSLPVVAMGSIPHIYQRAAFPHWAAPNALPA
jgi:hypothetical protein